MIIIKTSKPKKTATKRTSVRHCEIETRLCDDEGNPFITIEQLEEVIKNKSNCIKYYAFILHDKDAYSDEEAEKMGVPPGTLKPPHIHCLLKFIKNQTQHMEDIAKWFSLQKSCIQKIGRWSSACAYLIHANALGKFQYSLEEVTANFDIATEIEKAINLERDVEEIIEAILDGSIREYNKAAEIDGLTLIRYARDIREAFKVRQEYLLATEQERNTECVFITGPSGCGKTTLAKKIAREKGLDFYISSGSNDILDGYAQQPCLIFDDIRPSCLGLSDFLKLLDPNTACSVKSRYKNKYVNCELIILTSVLSLDTFYKNVFENETEPITQLKRRCQTYIQMDALAMLVSVWDKSRMRYSTPVVYKNDILAQYVSDEPLSREDIKQVAANLLPFLTPEEDIVLPPPAETVSEDGTNEMVSDEEFFNLMPSSEDEATETESALQNSEDKNV